MLSLLTECKKGCRRGLCLVAAAGLAAALPGFGQAGSSEAAAPSPSPSQAYVPTMTFAVASVKQSLPADSYLVSSSFPAPGSFRATNLDVVNLLLNAYQPDEYYRISGIPDSMNGAMFNVEAKADDSADEKLAKLSREQLSLEQQHMMQALLADRFHLKVHWAAKEGDVYDLVVRDPSKLRESNGAPPSPAELKDFDGRPVPDLYQRGDSQNGFDFVAHACPVNQLVDMLAMQFGRPVVDKTGLHGKYDFVLHYYQTRTADRDPNETNPMPPLEEALRNQLGLKLEPARGPVKTLVIDHIEKPSGN